MKYFVSNMILFFSLLQNCSKENKTLKDQSKENLPYMVTVTAPKEYPIEVHKGWLLAGNRKLICGMPRSGTENQGWANDGTEAGQGGSKIPSHLNLTYVAYAEKDFH